MRAIRSFCIVAALAGSVGAGGIRSQEPLQTLQQFPDGAVQMNLQGVSLQSQDPQQADSATNGRPSVPDTPAATAGRTDQSSSDSSNDQGRQPKRILGIIPNYRAVSANTHLPPLSMRGKFWLATQDTFDYSDFLFVGGLAGIAIAQNSQPSFGHGAEGYGRYYWHIFLDGAIENYMTEAIVPIVTKEDPRYYTLGKGGFFKRTGYAVTRLLITRTDSGHSTLNIAEVVGAGAAAGIGNAYYPAQSNLFVKTYQRWATQVALDGIFNVLKEFWPDIDRTVFHGKY